MYICTSYQFENILAFPKRHPLLLRFKNGADDLRSGLLACFPASADLPVGDIWFGCNAWLLVTGILWATGSSVYSTCQFFRFVFCLFIWRWNPTWAPCLLTGISYISNSSFAFVVKTHSPARRDYGLFIYSFLDGHMSCFQFGVIRNSTCHLLFFFKIFYVNLP